VWNLGRFVLSSKPDGFEASSVAFTEADEMRIAEARAMRDEVAQHLDRFELHLAGERAYHYVWHTFADKVVEEAKPRLRGDDPADAAAAWAMLEEVLETCLGFLHPFMPFVTEQVHQHVRDGGWLMTRRWNA
jgi:valyl-tRNA synthetase